MKKNSSFKWIVIALIAAIAIAGALLAVKNSGVQTINGDPTEQAQGQSFEVDPNNPPEGMDIQIDPGAKELMSNDKK
ncbi:hypothetical protein [Gordonibacter sp. Marseille-P4307]|uniref:hypothetical protein n=1 Tax=Gordonibacter sp. Marseille-P4307 TaxID=2161815 RepID=UPI000F538354|nr:hypothetical protein [Gordonibacter sp. Marseille-P4307]